jgi:3-dehydroquinate dehydratase/shikimate dehydrogenase
VQERQRLVHGFVAHARMLGTAHRIYTAPVTTQLSSESRGSAAHHTLIAVAITVEGSDEVSTALDMARHEVSRGARLVEWRVDALAEEPGALQPILRLVRECPAPCIVTIRHADEGGGYRGDDTDRVSLLEAIGTADAGPRYIDFEAAHLARSANIRQKVMLAVDHAQQPRDLKTSLILSAHDFEGRPADLTRRLAAMWSEPACAVAKIAWKARSIRDCLEAFELLREAPKPTIALCMGAFGMASRVLSAKFGAFLTYARPEGDPGTAPGQPTVSQLRELYRFDKLTPRTRVFGVAGWPIEHSLSPHLHNAGFGAIGFDGVYLPLPIPPEWEHFKASLHAMLDFKPLDLRGLSVTLPHKEHLVRFVREAGGRLDTLSERCGSANTLLVGDAGELEAINTDAPAAVSALATALSIDADASAALAAGTDPARIRDGDSVRRQWTARRVAVLGAGGVARAVSAGLSLAGAKVIVFNRTQARAEALESLLHNQPMPGGGRAHVVAGRPGELGCGCFHAFVNCTSVGMEGGPDPRGSPIDDDIPLEGAVVMDTVYRPRRTPLLRIAAQRGAKVVDGTAMFVRQAEMQFERFADRAAPPGLFEGLLQVALGA